MTGAANLQIYDLGGESRITDLDQVPTLMVTRSAGYNLSFLSWPPIYTDGQSDHMSGISLIAGIKSIELSLVTNVLKLFKGKH